MHTTEPAQEATGRHRRRELDPQLTFTEAERVSPEHLKDALHVLVTWLIRIAEPTRGMMR